MFRQMWVEVDRTEIQEGVVHPLKAVESSPLRELGVLTGPGMHPEAVEGVLEIGARHLEIGRRGLEAVEEVLETGGKPLEGAGRRLEVVVRSFVEEFGVQEDLGRSLVEEFDVLKYPGTYLENLVTKNILA